jgi:branched-chain amino acid transport system substrate-binding protein
MRRKTKVDFRIILLLFFALLIYKGIYSYRLTYDFSLQKRSEIAGQNSEDIHVAAVWKKNDRGFMDGVDLAVEEVNKQGIMLKSGDRVVKARIVLHEFDDSTEQSSRESRLSIAADHNIVAVIGHSSSASAIPASITYEYNGVLFISPVATARLLTDHGFVYTFSIIPSKDFFVGKLIEFAKEKKWQKLLLIYSRNLYGFDFYQLVMSNIEPPLEIVEAKSFFIEHSDYKALIYALMQKDFDAVVLGAANGDAAKMIKQLRTMGVDKPIIGGEGLDNQQVWDWSEKTANQVYMASIVPDHSDFNEKFKQAYGIDGGFSAYQGYESARVLADAIQKTGTSNPIQVASTLTYNYTLGYGGYLFDKNGLASNKRIYIKQIVDGKFVLIE